VTGKRSVPGTRKDPQPLVAGRTPDGEEPGGTFRAALLRECRKGGLIVAENIPFFLGAAADFVLDILRRRFAAPHGVSAPFALALLGEVVAFVGLVLPKTFGIINLFIVGMTQVALSVVRGINQVRKEWRRGGRRKRSSQQGGPK
jgi:hypothetical protein